jgi:hypothetical protein
MLDLAGAICLAERVTRRAPTWNCRIRGGRASVRRPTPIRNMPIPVMIFRRMGRPVVDGVSPGGIVGVLMGGAGWIVGVSGLIDGLVT